MNIGSGRASAALVACTVALGLTCAGSALGARHRPGVLRRAAFETTTPIAAAPERGLHLGWLRPHLPAGGAVDGGEVVHAVRAGETWATIAEAYLDLTGVYDGGELAKAIASENLPASKHGASPGLRLRIPHILATAPRNGRLPAAPPDEPIKGIYVRGSTAGGKGYTAVLDRVAAHGMNAIVLDVKDYDGPVTYPSRVPLAVESGATVRAPMRSYARAVRFAHERGVRVIARVSCFNDQLMAKAHPGMAIRGVSGHPYRNGWVDPRNERAQGYVIDLAKEAIEAGADEIQLDYVRFPVSGMKNIDFGLDTKQNPRAKVDVITGFVERVHAMTRAHGVPLSLDVFGVIAFGKDADIQNLGQDPSELGRHAEFLSAMVYPSHYDAGFMGLDAPADHPELVGLGVKHMLAEMEAHGAHGGAKIRPWLQAMRHTSTNYGPAFIQEEIRTGDQAGGVGWLLWNPGGSYEASWSAVHKPHDGARHASIRP